MNRNYISLSLKAFIIGFMSLAHFNAVFAQRVIQSFDKDWRFIQGDTSGAEKTTFSDAGWRKLDVPHDWSIEGSYDRNNKTGRGGGYLPNGIGWYRKQFSIPAEYAKRKTSIEFDGIMANSDVWINGQHLGKRPFGYVALHYDISPYLKYGNNNSNIIAVKVDNTLQPASRWYSGAGIYRHTRLVITDPLMFDKWGVFITTPEVSKTKATVAVQATISNTSNSQQQVTLQTSILNAGGKEVATVKSNQVVVAGKSEVIKQQIPVTNPALWDIDQPNLYKAVTKIISGGKVVDDVTTTFGIREFRFDAATGFYLNGKNMKLKGVCLHHDGGAFGAAVPLRVWEKRLEMMKLAGANSIRTAHNPMAPEFLDLCDRMGLLVMNETFDTWTARKSNADQGYNLYFNDWWEKDTRDIVMKDRNHPSVIMYSVGNEIRDNLKDSAGFKRYRDQQDLIHRLDGTRPVTMAIFRPNDAGVYQNGFVEMMDIVGQNYRENELVAVHKAKPQLKVIGTENTHTRDAWLVLRDNPFMAGQYLWTGVDYLGEADWPRIGSNSGLIDRIGRTKPRTFERQSWWSDKPMVHVVRSAGNAGAGELINDWSPADVDTYDEANVQVYSNCEEVELFLNDKSLGAKTRPADDAPRIWKITFERGTLKAVAKNKGAVVAIQELETAGEPAKVLLTADKNTLANNWDDVVFVKASVVDSKGIKIMRADHLFTFKISGPGIIAAVDNGNTSSHESYRGNQRQAYLGDAYALIKAIGSKGVITITASAPGLGESTITIEAKDALK